MAWRALLMLASSSMGRFRTAVQMLLLTLVLGCGQTLAPNDAASSYVLQQVGPDPLPAVLFSSQDVTIRVFADTIRLSVKGTGTQSTLEEVRPTKGMQVDTASITASFSFRETDGRLEIAFSCPINANCAPPPHLIATLIPAGLRVDYAMGSRVPLIYARLPGS